MWDFFLAHILHLVYFPMFLFEELQNALGKSEKKEKAGGGGRGPIRVKFTCDAGTKIFNHPKNKSTICI